MEIENYKLKDFLRKDRSIIERYVVALQYLNPEDTAREVFHMKLKHVEFIKKNLYSGNDEGLVKIVAKVQRIKIKEVYEMRIVEFFSIISSVKKQIDIILRAENSSLSPNEVNYKWEMVEGEKKMAKFGIYNTLESLSGGDALKYKLYMEMEYSEIFTILYMRKTAAELQREMDKIKTEKK